VNWSHKGKLMTCDDCERLARVKDAGAKLAGVNKRGSISSITISVAGQSVTLTGADAQRLRMEARRIREGCTHRHRPSTR
jgi:hypothetical protein